MKRFTCYQLIYGVIACLVMLGCFTFAAHAEDVTLAWDKPDGSVAGYNIYYGKMGTDFKSSPKLKINNGDETQCDISGLDQGEMYGFVATSFDRNGNESTYSEELYHNIPARGEELLDDEWTDNNAIDGAKGAENASGGGDNSDAPLEMMGVADLSDTYFAVEVFDNGAFGTALLEITFDGAGGLTYEELNKSEGGDTAIGKTYEVEGNGGLTIEGADKGAVSSDAGYFVSGKMSSDASPLMLFGIKQAKGVQAADFKGDYKLYMFTSAPDAEAAAAAATGMGGITADGEGNVKKVDGKGFDATYTVDSETGRLMIKPGATYSPMNGALSADGSIFAAVDTSSEDGTLVFVIGIKAAASLSPADLAGGYFVNEFEYDETLQMPTGSLSKMSVTADGGYNLEEIDNSCDCPPESSSGTFVPGDNGEIQAVDDVTQESASGGVAPGGEVFTVVTESAIGVGVRQASAPAAESGGGGGGGGGCFIGSLF